MQPFQADSIARKNAEKILPYLHASNREACKLVDEKRSLYISGYMACFFNEMLTAPDNGLVIDTRNYMVVVNGEEHMLTPLAAALLERLYTSKGIIVTMSQLKIAGWNHYNVSDNSVRVVMVEVRKIVGADKIKCFSKRGYLFSK